MANLTGKIIDVTNQPPGSVVDIHVKAPSARVGSGTGAVVSSPAEVDYNESTGELTVTDLTGGLSWLVIEGVGWSDTVALAVAEGMTTLVEAIANAAGAPGMADYVSLLANLELAVEGVAQEAVDEAADAIKWKRGMLSQAITNLADVPDGDWVVASASHAGTLGLPVAQVSRISKHSFGSAFFYLVSTGGANPRLWLRYGNIGEWKQLASLNDIPAPWWRGTVQIPAGETLDSIAVGEYTIWSASHATELGLPTKSQGELTKRAFGNTTTWSWVAFLIDGFQEWKRRVNTTGVDTGWVDVSGHGDDPGMESTPAGMKLVPLALSLGQGSTTAAGGAMSGSFRVPIRYAAPITRWRLCFTNHNPRYGSTRNAQSVVSSVVVGAHTDGVYSSAPATVATNITVAADGSVARTGWQTAQIGDGRDMAISYRYTTSGPEAPPLLVGGGWDLGTSSPSTLNPSKTRTIRLPFDMWIEAETYATTPVIAGFGDSITCGVGATVPVFDSWPNVYARTVGALPMHYSTSGDTFENWGRDEKAYKVTRWDHLARPDAVLWAMGTNDMASTRTFSQHQSNTLKMAEIIRERWSDNLYLATIMPRNNEDPAVKSMRDQWNTWAGAQPYFRDTFDFATAVRDPATGGILPEYNADGLHLSTAGSAAQAGAITRPIANHAVSDLKAADMALGQRLDGRVPDTLALRSDTTVGTRILAGDTMIYGDTGWREIPLTSGTGRALVRRQNNTVNLHLVDWLNEGNYATHIVALPSGFVYATPATTTGSYFIASSRTWEETASILGMYSRPSVSWLRRIDGSTQRPTAPQSAQITFLTTDPWPTTLPGTPA